MDLSRKALITVYSSDLKLLIEILSALKLAVQSNLFKILANSGTSVPLVTSTGTSTFLTAKPLSFPGLYLALKYLVPACLIT